MSGDDTAQVLGTQINEVYGLQKQLRNRNKDITLEHRLNQFSHAFHKIAGMCRQAEHSQCELYIGRQQIMLLHYDLEYWLLRIITTAVDSHERGLNAPWINNLVQHVQGIVNRNNPPTSTDGFQVDSSCLLVSSDLQLLSAFLPPDSPCQPHAHYATRRLRTIKLTRSILSQWFGFSDDEEHLRQTDLLFALSSVFDSEQFSGLLLTNPVWDAYQNPRASMVQRSRTKTGPLTRAQENGFISQLSSLPCLDPKHAHFQLYARLERARQAMLQPFTIHKPPVLSEATSASVSGLNNDGQASQPAASPAPVPSTDAQASLPALQYFTDFLRALSPLIDPVDTQTSLTSLQEFVLDDLDFYLPFREEAPSRKHITKAGGPFDPANINERSGIFGAEVFRAISFNTSKLHSHCGHFSSLSDWKAHRGSDPSLEDLFCNPCAYGTTNGRSTNNAPSYWKHSKFMHEYLSQPDHRGFTAFITYFLKAKHRPIYMGPLSIFLLAEDLVYAGVLDLPTEEEFATIVVKMNKGAMQTLFKLGLAGESDTPVEKAAAFLRVYRHLASVLSPEEQNRMGFGLFMFEHALCKYGRLCHKLKVSFIPGPCSYTVTDPGPLVPKKTRSKKGKSR